MSEKILIEIRKSNDNEFSFHGVSPSGEEIHFLIPDVEVIKITRDFMDE